MLRIGGIFLPENKKIKFALLKISGIGIASSSKILFDANINPNIKCIELSQTNLFRIRELLVNKYLIETFLKRTINLNIKNLIAIKCLRGKRHKLKLPVHGQRTRTNARTKRGQKQIVSIKKK